MASLYPGQQRSRRKDNNAPGIKLCSEEEGYKFFCHQFDELERIGLKTDMLPQQRGMDTVLNIEDDNESQNPLVPAKMEILDVNPHLLFVPSDLTVNRRRILPRYLKPRCLEDEGFYVCRRPQVHSKMMNKMDNRLIEEEKGQSWFEEDGFMITLPDPIQKYWLSYIDFPFSRQSPCLATVYMSPKKPESAGSVAIAECYEGQWQLDLNLVGLFFTHHPLFSREHVLVQRLHELYEHYEVVKMKGDTAFLQHKLSGLKKSEKVLIATDETPDSKLRDLRQEIQKTHVALNKARRADTALVRRVVAVWKCVKALRAENGYASTTVKLELQKIKTRISDSVTNTTGNDKKNKRMPNRVGDVTIKQHYLFREANGLVEEARFLAPGQDEEMASDFVNQKLDQLPLVPVVRMCGVATPTTNCPLDEMLRRYELAKHRITVKIFYNGKHVSTSEPSTFDSDFRVDIQQMFSMQLIHNPQKIMLEICETVKHKTTIVAKVYVPIPDRNMLSSNATVAKLEFSSDRNVEAYYTGVGSNVPFKIDEKEEEVCLMTSARLLYVVSWAVDDCGYPMAPSAKPQPPSFTKHISSLHESSSRKWTGDLQFDPHHPHNIHLSELLREACWQRGRATGHFRLNHLEEEFDFTSEEELRKVKRFALLQQRSSKASVVSSSKPIPLQDRDISEDMLTKYDTSPRLSVMGENPITIQRARSIHYIQTALNLARTNLSNIKRKYKFSDIIKESHEADTPREFDWGGFGPKRTLRPQCVKTKATSTCSFSDGDLRIHFALNNAQALPVRQEAFLKHSHARGSCCGLNRSSHHSLASSSHRAVLQAQVQPFVEVRFQEMTYESCIEQGPSPCWREKFSLSFKSIGGDYSQAGLSKVEDDIIINVFDDISCEIIESSSLRGCGTKVFSGKQWLGSVTLPFRSLLQQTKVYENLSISTPVMLLGYTWTGEDSVSDQSLDTLGRKDTSFLNVFITLDPDICLAEDQTDDNQKSLWLFSTDEDEELLDLIYEYEKQCKSAAGWPKQRVITTVVNNEGRLVLAQRFFNPLPPPQEVVLDSSDNSISVLERVAAYVSLFPTVPFPCDIGDRGDMWLASEQCLELSMGNEVSLAVLLCNFFHHLKVNVWLLLGTSAIEGERAYVITQEETCFVLWDQRNGKHYQPYDSLCPLKTVDCLASGQNVWFNIQVTRNMPITFDVSNTATWKPLFSKGFNSDSSSMPKEMKYYLPQMDIVNSLQRRIETKLRCCVMDWRSPHPTSWNPRCADKLYDVLKELELNPAPGTIELMTDRFLDTMKDYKVTGFPMHMAYRDMSTVTEAVCNTKIHSTEIPGMEFALSVYVHPYPNHILSVWIFLATLIKR